MAWAVGPGLGLGLAGRWRWLEGRVDAQQLACHRRCGGTEGKAAAGGGSGRRRAVELALAACWAEGVASPTLSKQQRGDPRAVNAARAHRALVGCRQRSHAAGGLVGGDHESGPACWRAQQPCGWVSSAS